MNMLLLTIIGFVFVVLGSIMSVFKSRATMEYYQTIVRDGRRDENAKRTVRLYYFGYILLAVGLIMILIGFVSIMMTNVGHYM